MVESALVSSSARSRASASSPCKLEKERKHMCKIYGFGEVHSPLIEAWGKGGFQHMCRCFSLDP